MNVTQLVANNGILVNLIYTTGYVEIDVKICFTKNNAKIIYTYNVYFNKWHLGIEQSSAAINHTSEDKPLVSFSQYLVLELLQSFFGGMIK